jgi:hypothetical protein
MVRFAAPCNLAYSEAATVAVTVGLDPPDKEVRFARAAITGTRGVPLPHNIIVIPSDVRADVEFGTTKLTPSRLTSSETLNDGLPVVLTCRLTAVCGVSNEIAEPAPATVAAFNDVPTKAILFSSSQNFC